MGEVWWGFYFLLVITFPGITVSFMVPFSNVPADLQSAGIEYKDLLIR